MSDLEIRKTRLGKLEKLKKSGENPYPEESKRTRRVKEALEDFDNLSKRKELVVLAGRIFTIRKHGGLTFVHFGDGSAKIQAFFGKNKVGHKAYSRFLDNFDMGDFVEIRGTLFKTKKGEKTIKVKNFKMLAKSLIPLPDKWYGLKDEEIRFRKRYLDLIFNPKIKERFKTRSKIIQELRSFFEKEGFLEVETPILQPIYGGASAKPFKTHLNALDLDLYLRISPELYLKRLIVGGFEKVYEIGKCFRNEGMDRSHNPDFTMLELYWAYQDHKGLMKFTEEMISSLVKKVFEKKKIKYEGKEIDFSTPWPRIEFSQLLRKYTGIDIDGIHLEALKKEAKKFNVKVEKGEGKYEIADKIYKKECLSKLWNPTFVIHYPVDAFSLSKPFEKNPEKSSSFQLIVANWELLKAFAELNDPTEQRKRFKDQEKLFKRGLEEAQRMDEDFVEALEYGMPPTAGFGMGVDRLIAILTDSHNLRESILFPTMRPKE